MKLNENPTEFSWIRVVRNFAVIEVIWVLCMIVTQIVAASLDAYWVRAGMPGFGLALILAVSGEYIRRGRARRS